MSALRGRRERVIAERDGRAWLVMFPDGEVRWYPTQRAVLRALRARLGTDAYLVTEIEWRP